MPRGHQGTACMEEQDVDDLEAGPGQGGSTSCLRPGGK